MATRLAILSAGAVKFVVTGLVPAFATRTGCETAFEFGTIGVVQKRLADGAAVDIVMGTTAALDTLEHDGILLAGATVVLGRTRTGVCVRAGAMLPDIATPERFAQALLRAPSIAFSDPAAGGTSGRFFAGLIDRLGVTQAVMGKAVLCNNGDDVVETVASGRAQIGTTFLSEIVPNAGAEVVGPLPAGIDNATSYAAGIVASSGNIDAARQLIAHLVDPAHRPVWSAGGFEPALVAAGATLRPPVTASLTSADLVGTWRSAGQDRLARDGTITSTTGKTAPGFIMYTPEGVMMVLSVAPHDVPAIEVGRLRVEQKAVLADATVAYYGRYEVDRGIVLHHLELGLYPIWAGQTRVRYAELTGGRLTFTTDPDAGGTVSRIYWERI